MWAVSTQKSSLKFVVQEHQARSHHFDLLLERHGIFKSWAVPKDLPDGSETKRLAVRIADHDLEFSNFEGEIPEGQYGARHIRIWHKGSYEADHWSQRKIAFTLPGKPATDWLLTKLPAAA